MTTGQLSAVYLTFENLIILLAGKLTKRPYLLMLIMFFTDHPGRAGMKQIPIFPTARIYNIRLNNIQPNYIMVIVAVVVAGTLLTLPVGVIRMTVRVTVYVLMPPY